MTGWGTLCIVLLLIGLGYLLLGIQSQLAAILEATR